MNMELTWWSVSFATLTLFLVSRIQKFSNGKRALDNLPGLTVPFSPFAVPGVLIPTTWWNPGIEFGWRWKNFLYKRFNSETISMVPFIFGRPTIVTSNIDVAKQILGGSNKTPFGKPGVDDRGPLGYWGLNLLLTEGDMWRAHRRIVGPAFSQKLYEFVWNESLHLYSEMVVHEGFEGKKVVDIPKIQKITFNFAFLIIGRCGFDFPFSWTERIGAGKGSMSFPDAMRIFTRDLRLLQLPKMIRSLPITRMKQVNAALMELQSFMEKKIAEKESEVKDNGGEIEKDDIFSMLVQANHAESDAKLKLDDSELISNVFIMLLAGHETTAQSLAITLACLARYPERQQEVYEQIISVVGNDRDPTFEDMPKLNKVQACFYEALRMFPIAFAVTRDALEDGILNLSQSTDDGITSIAVRKGTHIIVDLIGLHRNANLFEDPDEYKPSRWYDVSNESEALAAFGLGQRSCIGRKFAITESICLISMFLRDWKIEPLTNPGESVDQWFERLSQAKVMLTLTVGEVGLRFVRRS
ncbi:cytochrome P450 [Cyathus striatus]|nr:cytochrome P450 [Cyathus striatus]